MDARLTAIRSATRAAELGSRAASARAPGRVENGRVAQLEPTPDHVEQIAERSARLRSHGSVRGRLARIRRALLGREADLSPFEAPTSAPD